MMKYAQRGFGPWLRSVNRSKQPTKSVTLVTLVTQIGRKPMKAVEDMGLEGW